MIGNNINKINHELFSSLLTRHQIGLEKPMKGSDSDFDSIDGMHFKCYKIDMS